MPCPQSAHRRVERICIGRHLFGRRRGLRGGFSFSPGLGQTLTEWIVGGAPSIDLEEFSPARLSDAPLDEAQLTAACVWQYAHYYDPPL